MCIGVCVSVGGHLYTGVCLYSCVCKCKCAYVYSCVSEDVHMCIAVYMSAGVHLCTGVCVCRYEHTVVEGRTGREGS